MRLYFCLAVSVLVSGCIALVLGFLGLCALTDCFGPAAPGSNSGPFGAVLIGIGLIPFASSVWLAVRRIRDRRVSTPVAVYFAALILVLVLLGIWQILMPEGEAYWVGLPLLLLGGALGGALLGAPAGLQNEEEG